MMSCPSTNDYGKTLGWQFKAGRDFSRDFPTDSSAIVLNEAAVKFVGLFGLTSFAAEQRTKEIGIRKVLGASVTTLWGMLSKEFLILVGLSCLIATPLAWYFMGEWLLQYNYRTPITWWVFAAATSGALLLTLCTVSFQALKAAVANPIVSLRAE